MLPENRMPRRISGGNAPRDPRPQVTIKATIKRVLVRGPNGATAAPFGNVRFDHGRAYNGARRSRQCCERPVS